MKKTLAVLSLIFILSFTLSADDNSLDYLEGYLEFQSGSGWEELYIGDAIASDALLRLSDNGYAEILIGDAVVTLIKDGSYRMADLISDVAGISNSTIDLKKKLTLSTDFEKWQQEATMGVRGAEQSADDLGTGMEDAYTYLNAGLELLAEEKYNDALVNFEEGWEFFEDDNCLFFSAVCYEALGQKRAYASSIQDVTVDYLDEEFVAAFIIRKGDLLMRSLSFEEAVSVLENFNKNSFDSTTEEDQKIHYLLGKSYLGLNKSSMARKEFNTSRELDPNSEVGRMAADALNNL